MFEYFSQSEKIFAALITIPPGGSLLASALKQMFRVAEILLGRKKRKFLSTWNWQRVWDESSYRREALDYISWVLFGWSASQVSLTIVIITQQSGAHGRT